LATSREIILITRALLQLTTAVGAIGRAITELAEPTDKAVTDKLSDANNASETSLQYLKELVELIEKDRE
jgi:hypothetical protein